MVKGLSLGDPIPIVVPSLRSGGLILSGCYNANPSSMMDALDSSQRGAYTSIYKNHVLVMDELGMDAESLHRGITKRLLPEEGRADFIVQKVNCCLQEGHTRLVGKEVSELADAQIC